jgi:hypothetical protein
MIEFLFELVGEFLLQVFGELLGLRVVEFTHMVMGPTCGMVLADLGAEVIKVEPHRRRQHAPAAGRRRGLLPDVQPQQEEPGGRPEAARRRSCGALAGRPPTSCSRTSSPARWTSTGLDYASLRR